MTEDQLENTKSPGQWLTEAREKLSLSQKEIASRLNLREEIIAALDANNFDELPAATYVRGYIRSYARAVNLNADTIIEIYEATAEAPPEILPDVKPKVQASSRDKPVKAMTYLVTFSLVILIIAWWQGQHIVGTDLFMSNSKTSEGGKYPGGFTYTYEIVTHPGNPSDASDPDDPVIMPITLAPEISASPGISDSADSLNLEATDQLSLGTPANGDAVTNPATLKLDLTAESWIEVYDAKGEKLHVSLAKPGGKIDLTGDAPLSVKLGNARGVKVIFNGKPFDTSAFTKAGVARFQLE